MGKHERTKRLETPDIKAMKGRQRLVGLTAHSKCMAEVVDPYVDLIFVGDAAAMVCYGHANTLPMSLELIIAHAQAAVRGAKTACVVVDLPFGSYEESPRQAFRSAARILAESGAQAVKLEGGREMRDTVQFLVDRGIPVMGHIGLMPQYVNATGGFRTQGREPGGARRLVQDAMALANAGVFAVLIEATCEPVARDISTRLSIPTIGVGASPCCDGQVLVTEDMLGLFVDFTPRFVKRYAQLGKQAEQAVACYAADVRNRRFPSMEHCFGAASATEALVGTARRGR
ncbi:3-methyl-2-oxobutanoate hydroxymethyltransferase [Alkalilimnicola ehrlichii]|uniref:3-methyl-2-oxobutanoate hydroxymethyltransferase n=1 Tax=Alkalilimnicola ehrlichii TaxID=351052 RepID=A0A3E0X0X9_9GAMM|nr:3-methyl-2-oxobutanoate hydroxymethyltransferase [Alkalilimnicola ehrlichii]RFA30749.1 3-methyl-2-oxobutanoate hydroxymethyltransferase [Alkalilimnicola ehrlichii]RFA38325.1 3-methyl-2-oxobutanoate hydroxymethyltransferase [Alkalilimnicola ehrlichii]